MTSGYLLIEESVLKQNNNTPKQKTENLNDFLVFVILIYLYGAFNFNTCQCYSARK